MKKIKRQKNETSSKKFQEPIGISIAKAVYSAKKISERIIGYISYDIKFVKATYTGKTQRPAKITAIEKGIVGILLVDETVSFEKIGMILGLDVVNDKAEKTILRSAIDTLLSFNAIEGDDSCIALTEDGRVYADKGERPDTYSKSFDILVDTQHPTWLNIKNCIGENIKAIEEINTPCDDLGLDLEQIKSYAEYQAQDVHYPQNRYLLESAIWHEGHKATYKIYVCFVQNVATDEVRAFVYDDKLKGLNKLFAEEINKDEALKSELFSNCIRIECENDEETEMLEGEAVEIAKAEIPIELKEAEEQMIQEEEDAENIKDRIITEKQSVSVLKTQDKDRLRKKALYDSLSFEVELQKIFNEDNPDEIWIISPWIRGTKNKKNPERSKRSVFVEERGPLIEKFLEDENKRVFIAYSAPSIDRLGKVKLNDDGFPILNIDDDVKAKIEILEDQYPNFFFVELPEFHVKNVIEVKDSQKVLFSGSFNVLSFSVSKNQTHIRREEMTLAHHSVAKNKYQSYQLEFAEIYAERIREQVAALDDSFASNYKNERLEYFLSIDNHEIQKLFLPIQELLEEKSLVNTIRELRQKLAKIEQELVAANMSGLNPKEKKRIESLLANMENEMQKNGIVDPSMFELLTNNKELLGKIHINPIFPERKKTYIQKPTTPTTKLVVEKKDNMDNVLDYEPKATIEGLALYIASLSHAFINRELRKTSLNAKLLSIIKNKNLVNLLEMVNVTTSRNTENAFDLVLGINGFLFKFPTLFNNRENFEYNHKRTNKRLTSVNPTNIESVIKKLS